MISQRKTVVALASFALCLGAAFLTGCPDNSAGKAGASPSSSSTTATTATAAASGSAAAPKAGSGW